MSQTQKKVLFWLCFVVGVITIVWSCMMHVTLLQNFIWHTSRWGWDDALKRFFFESYFLFAIFAVASILLLPLLGFLVFYAVRAVKSGLGKTEVLNLLTAALTLIPLGMIWSLIAANDNNFNLSKNYYFLIIVGEFLFLGMLGMLLYRLIGFRTKNPSEGQNQATMICTIISSLFAVPLCFYSMVTVFL